MRFLVCTVIFTFILQSCSQRPDAGKKEHQPDMTRGELVSKQEYLEYFKSLEGEKCLSGQFIRWNYNASLEEINNTHQASGKWVGMLGADYYGNFQDSVPSPGCQYSLANSVIDSYYEKNGLVNLSVHFINPQTGGSAWDHEIDFDSLLIDNSRVQTNFITELDSVATGLKKLQTAGVMIMFRPFHEMNGGWFWWGEREGFTELWKFTYHYLVVEKGLNNLLWCWSPDAGPGNIHQYYPGDRYVDMVGLDAYSPDLPAKALDAYNEIRRYDKPFGFSEYGCVQGSDTLNAKTFDYSIFLDWLKHDFPDAVYFLVWRDHWGFNGKPGVDALLNDPRIVNRDDLAEAF
jgi:mannan endo-1,4-beta-mannosidase